MSAMRKTLRGILEVDGAIWLSEPCDIKGPAEVVVTIARESDPDHGESETSDEWRAEIHRRAQQIDDGEVELIEEKDFLERLKSA